MNSLARLTAITIGVAGCAGTASAFPVTWTLSGAIDSTVSATGIFSGIAVFGDTYTVTHTFDTTAPGSICCGGLLQDWFSGSSTSLTINGHSFGVGDVPVHLLDRFDQRRVFADSGNTELIIDQRMDYTVGNGGIATSTVAGALSVDISWHIRGDDSHLMFNPAWPLSVNLATWDATQLTFRVTGTGGSLFQIADPTTAFQSFHSTADDPVPAPAGAALVALGLLGIGALRRRA
jgi:MYXO-CTERM domain-containing protein